MLLLFCDLAALALAAVLAYIIAKSEYRLSYIEGVNTSFLICGGNVVFMALAGAYKPIWRYARVEDFLRCVLGLSVTAIIACCYGFIYGKQIFVRHVLILSVISSVFVLGMRVAYLVIGEITKRYVSTVDKIPVLIIGAGAACMSILNEIKTSESAYYPVCIVDDDRDKIGRSIHGVKVVGKVDSVPALVKQYGIKLIWFAIPSCEDPRRAKILEMCNKTGCDIKVIPYLHELFDGVQIINQLREIDINDLLGRQCVQLDSGNIDRLLRDKVCMVTGGGGSIGSELCRQISLHDIKKLIILDVYENSAYEIEQELRRRDRNLDIAVHIATVRDLHKMEVLFGRYRPDIVFHAAAHKHVPLMETSPEEAVKNNVFGTYNIAKMCDKFGVGKMVLISTDKAVNPTNVMGATKRICEMIMQMMSQTETKTEFTCVRFGNVLGSNGSVIPLFKKQIEDGGPVTVTHPDIIRYFMTIPEAVGLVMQSAAMSKGGEIFILDMGEPVKITTLAENLIRMYGYEPGTEMKIEFTGLRPGEKLYEELLMSEEGLIPTKDNKIFIGNQIPVEKDGFTENLSYLRAAAEEDDSEGVVDAIKGIVPTFTHMVLEEKEKAIVNYCSDN